MSNARKWKYAVVALIAFFIYLVARMAQLEFSTWTNWGLATDNIVTIGLLFALFAYIGLMVRKHWRKGGKALNGE